MLRRLLHIAPLVLLLPLLAACGPPGPEKTVERFYRALEQGEIDAAMELMAAGFSDTIGEEKLRAGLEAQARDIRKKGGIRSFEITEREMQGELATVRGTVVFDNGDTEQFSTDLVREDGRWKIDLDK